MLISKIKNRPLLLKTHLDDRQRMCLKCLHMFPVEDGDECPICHYGGTLTAHVRHLQTLRIIASIEAENREPFHEKSNILDLPALPR